MEKVIIKDRVIKHLKEEVILLTRDDLASSIDGLDVSCQFVDKRDRFLGTGYLSKQNKGVAWFFNRNRLELDRTFFESLFREAKKKRASYQGSASMTAYRLFNQEGDGFGGLTVDLYSDYALFSWYNPFVYHLKETISAAFRQVFPEVKGAYEKIRFQSQKNQSAHLFGEEAPEQFEIVENGVSYTVFLNDGLMTGIFLDQHDVRGELLDGFASGKTVLNLFSYTAAFSIAAAMGGALSTTSVDLAKRSVALSQNHFKANHLEEKNHQLIVMDVFDYLRYAQRHQLTFDIIVIDPPSFARNKKQTFSVAKDYHRLIQESLPLLRKKGYIIASTNAANLSLERFKKELDKGFGKVDHQYIRVNRLPADFSHTTDERSNYLKVVTIEVNQ